MPPDKKLPAKKGKGPAKKNLELSNHYYINYGIAGMGFLLAAVSLHLMYRRCSYVCMSQGMYICVLCYVHTYISHRYIYYVCKFSGCTLIYCDLKNKWESLRRSPVVNRYKSAAENR